MDPMSGQQIGRYEIIETLGRGAMGVVYLARDPLIDRRVALKTLRVDLDDELAHEFRERFLREARAAGGLSHTGIVTVHDVGEDPESGLVFIAMEFIEGRDLKQLVNEGVSFRPSEAARIAAEVALALDYAHGRGVVHRDIKPANIILTRNGTPKITDFGIARIDSSNLTVDGQFLGTPNFMSPEQVTGDVVDGRSDIFSLGVVLFTLLTGSRPFSGETMHEVTMKVVQEAPPIPSAVAPQVPAAFNPIILKCLEKDPDKRFQTGAELAEVLAALARSLTEREPSDPARTGVFQPDLPTRHQREQPAATTPRTDAERRSILRDLTSPRMPGDPGRLDQLLDHLPLPEFLSWKVSPAWVAIVIAGWSLLCLSLILVLALRRDSGPFPAPSDGAVRNLHSVARTLHVARQMLAAGELADAERAAASVIDQVPASRGARQTLSQARARLEEERLGAATRDRVIELVGEGREAFRAGQYRTAVGHFEEALQLDPENELAESYLDLARERQQRRPSVSAARPTPLPQSSGPPPLAEKPRPQPTPARTRVTVFFSSPIPAGVITISTDGDQFERVPFDFTKKGFLGIKRSGGGTVREVVMLPSGQQRITVTLHDGEGKLLGSSAFQPVLAPGSDWTLRIDLPSKSSRASIFLVEASR
jgi:serine/threonine protein kinase